MNRLRQKIKRLMGAVLPTGRLLLCGDGQLTPSALNGPPPATTISLTFDDGPHPEWTPVVLDALDEAGWKGTFFLIGREAAAYPHLVREIVARGHELGNHSYHHAEPDAIGVRQFIEGVVRTRELFASLTGQQVNLMRPPKGRLDLWKTRGLWRSGQTVVLWNIDPKDFELTRLEQATDWATRYAPASGDIVLLHDRLPHAAEIVRTLARQHGDQLTSVPVSTWLQSRRRLTVKECLHAVGEMLIS